MNVYTTSLADLCIAENRQIADSRGSFSRLFCDQALAAQVGARQIVQINLSRTAEVGSVRGMHYQHAPYAEMKFVRCLRGRVWDVAVDIRAGSPTFLQWVAQELTPENGLMMMIPEGFAHGFQTLAADSELLYLHTAPYTPAAEGGLSHRDPRLNIAWPLPISSVSPRDQEHPLIANDYLGITI